MKRRATRSTIVSVIAISFVRAISCAIERVVAACMVACLVKGEGFAVAGARDEFHLAAIVQNLKTMALRLVGPPPRGTCAAIA